MKKLLLFLSVLLIACAVLIACGGNSSESTDNGSEDQATAEPSQTNAETKKSAVSTMAPATETEASLTKKPDREINLDDPTITFVKEFPAPEAKTGDDLRKIVLDYMLEESAIKWKAGENFTIEFNPKVEHDFGCHLEFKKGVTYEGVPYTGMASSLEHFEQFVKDGVFKNDIYYYDDCVGNNCSTAIVVAYNRIMDFPGSGGFKPTVARYGVLMYPIELKVPEGSYFSRDLINLNGKDKIFEAYAALDAGDMLYKNIETSGHVRMVDHVEVKTSLSGKPNYAQSQVVCVEQTNAFDQQRKLSNNINSTFFVDRKYAFSTLADTEFEPVSLNIFREEAPVLKSAYITYTGKNTPEDAVQKQLIGKVESNFSLNYVRFSLTDGSGNIVKVIDKFLMNRAYTYDIRKDSYYLFDGVAPGTYTYTLRAGIARGGVDLESFQVTLP